MRGVIMSIAVVVALLLAGCREGAPAVEEEDVAPPEAPVAGWQSLCDGFRYTIRQGAVYACANSWGTGENCVLGYANGELVANYYYGTFLPGGMPVTIIHRNGASQTFGGAE